MEGERGRLRPHEPMSGKRPPPPERNQAAAGTSPDSEMEGLSRRKVQLLDALEATDDPNKRQEIQRKINEIEEQIVKMGGF